MLNVQLYNFNIISRVLFYYIKLFRIKLKKNFFSNNLNNFFTKSQIMLKFSKFHPKTSHLINKLASFLANYNKVPKYQRLDTF